MTFTYNNIEDLLKAMDELKSMEGNELDLIKRGLDQLELILDIKEKQLEDCFQQIENYKKTITLLERRLKRAEEQIKQLSKEKNQNQRKEEHKKDFFDFIP